MMHIYLFSSIFLLILIKNSFCYPLASIETKSILNERLVQVTVLTSTQKPKFTGVYLKNLSHTSSRVSTQDGHSLDSHVSSEASSTTHKLPHSNDHKEVNSTKKVINSTINTTTTTKAHVHHESVTSIHTTISHSDHTNIHNVHNTHDNANHNDHGSQNSDPHASAESHSTEGHHHLPPPSYQLHVHNYTYKPAGFHLFAQDLGMKKILIGLDYKTINHYDRYVVRIRYHGHEEYSTNKIKLHKNETNKLILNKFLDAPYIVCVSLFSSTGLPEYPPISTSDMCIDITVGETIHIGGHHSTTGLLSPLLVAVAAVLLAFIVIGQNIKNLYHGRHHNRQSEAKNLNAGRENASEIRKSDTQIKFEQVIRHHEDPKWQAAAQICQIVDNKSYDDLNDPKRYQNITAKRYSIIEDYYSRRNSRFNDQNLTSLETLSHLLDNKPWTQYSNK